MDYWLNRSRGLIGFRGVEFVSVVTVEVVLIVHRALFNGFWLIIDRWWDDFFVITFATAFASTYWNFSFLYSWRIWCSIMNIDIQRLIRFLFLDTSTTTFRLISLFYCILIILDIMIICFSRLYLCNLYYWDFFFHKSNLIVLNRYNWIWEIFCIVIWSRLCDHLCLFVLIKNKVISA